MERTEEFELAIKEAELLKALVHGGVVARQFLFLVEENKKLQEELAVASSMIDDFFKKEFDSI